MFSIPQPIKMANCITLHFWLVLNFPACSTCSNTVLAFTHFDHLDFILVAFYMLG